MLIYLNLKFLSRNKSYDKKIQIIINFFYKEIYKESLPSEKINDLIAFLISKPISITDINDKNQNIDSQYVYVNGRL